VKLLSGSEGLLEWRKVSGLVDIQRAGDRELQIILGAAMLKLWEPNEALTSGTESRWGW